jgi:hypothetical protein
MQPESGTGTGTGVQSQGFTALDEIIVVQGELCTVYVCIHLDRPLRYAVCDSFPLSVHIDPPHTAYRIPHTAYRIPHTAHRTPDNSTPPLNPTPQPHHTPLPGKVQPGYGRGSKKLGFPTANLPQFDSELSFYEVANGVYCGWASVQGRGTVPCVVNVGRSPTFVGQVMG